MKTPDQEKERWVSNDQEKELYDWVSEVLTERERTVVYLRFHEEKTLAQVAEVIGVKTRERVRQIQNIALSKLRRAARKL
jgi:RNA polymerase primary sigma factor